MFKELAELARTTTLSLLISSVSDTEMKVLVIPKAKEGANSALSTPLELIATPEELDEKLGGILTQYTTNRKTLEQSLEENRLYMEAQAKTAQKPAKSITAESSVKPPSVDDAQQSAQSEELPEDDDLFS